MRVRYYCHAGLPTGYGKAALEYALALDAHTDVELDLRLMPSGSAGQFVEGRGAVLAGCLNRGGEPDVVLVHTLPRDCIKVLDIEGIRAETPSVAFTTWEAWSCPEEIAAPLEDAFTRILSPSLVSAQALSVGTGDCRGFQDAAAGAPEGCKANFAVVPHCYDGRDPEISDYDRATSGHNRALIRRLRRIANEDVTEPYCFYYVGAWNDRKNVDGLLRAFANCVANDPIAFHARLILQCPKADQRRFLRAAAATGVDAIMPRIMFRNELVSDEQIWELHGEADCFVTASRGEAWNLGAFEAMLTRAHIIAPAGQGSDDFLGRFSGREQPDLVTAMLKPFATSANLYPATIEPAFQDAVVVEQPGGDRIGVSVSGPQGLSAGYLWWEPSIRQLAVAMMDAVNGRFRDVRSSSLLSVSYDPAARFGHEAVAKQLLHELEIAHG